MRILSLIAMSMALCAAQFYSRPGLQPSQTVTGTGSIEGSVVNELTGEPIKKAQVTLSVVNSLSAVTDASGHFAFRQLAAGQFIIQAHAANFSGTRGFPGVPAERRVALIADQKKDGVTIALIPNASLTGHVVDEDGAPLANCNVGALDYNYNQGMKGLATRAGANTDDKGEYLISNLTPGKYYVMARCFRMIPLPHAFIRRGSGVEVPTQTYAVQLYPGVADFSGAARVAVAPGAASIFK